MKTKAQISYMVITKLISTFVFATQIVQSLYFLNAKFQASSHLLWLYSLFCVGPRQKNRRPVFSQHGSSKNVSFIRTYTVPMKLLSLTILWKRAFCYQLFLDHLRTNMILSSSCIPKVLKGATKVLKIYAQKYS